AVVAQPAPPREGVPVEQEAPARRALGGRQLVGRCDARRFGLRGAGRGQCRHQQERSANHDIFSKGSGSGVTASRAGCSVGARTWMMIHADTYASPQTTKIGA